MDGSLLIAKYGFDFIIFKPSWSLIRRVVRRVKSLPGCMFVEVSDSFFPVRDGILEPSTEGSFEYVQGICANAQPGLLTKKLCLYNWGPIPLLNKHIVSAPVSELLLSIMLISSNYLAKQYGVGFQGLVYYVTV